jgi:hypothetical protein
MYTLDTNDKRYALDTEDCDGARYALDTKLDTKERGAVLATGMTAICKTEEPMAEAPSQVADALLTAERSILPRLAD